VAKGLRIGDRELQFDLGGLHGSQYTTRIAPLPDTMVLCL
jgi:hypothetical protein